MLSEREVSAAIGSTAYGPDGDKIGTVEHFYVDDRTGVPTWVAVTVGLFGTRHSIVPATDARFVDGSLQVPVNRGAVRSAPHLIGDHLDPTDEAELRQHYGLDTADPADGDLLGFTTPEADGETTSHDDAPLDDAPLDDAPLDDAPLDDTTGDDTPVQRMPPPGPPPPAVPAPRPGTGPATDRRAAGPSRGDGGMVRSEERLRISTDQVPTTRARLVKYVVTEEVQITVPVRREEVRLEQVPIDTPDPGPGETLLGGAAEQHQATTPGGLPEEIVLHAERPVVTIEVVPVERVRLRTETVTDTAQVTEQVRRERVVVDQSGS